MLILLGFWDERQSDDGGYENALITEKKLNNSLTA
jgi:hypothetical protein